MDKTLWVKSAIAALCHLSGPQRFLLAGGTSRGGKAKGVYLARPGGSYYKSRWTVQKLETPRSLEALALEYHNVKILDQQPNGLYQAFIF